MKHKLENGTLTFYLDGRIDSNNAQATENEINDIRAANPHNALVFDAEKLEYISSAGLRIVLRAKKAVNDTKIINVCPDVYEIFDMTGFTEMMTIEKAYRVISVEGCEAIGQGANGKVYRINPDTIVKVYNNPDSLDDIQRERDLAKKAFVLGIPTAISYDVAKVGEGYGSVFELLNAKSFAKLIVTEPERFDEIIDLYVDLLKKIHGTVVKKGDMPDMKKTAVDWAVFDMEYLPEEYGKKLYKLVTEVPENDHMMHGDYHVKNVMMQDGEALLIDMDTLCVGDPVFEFGSIFNAYIGFSELDRSVSAAFLGIPREITEKIWRATVEKYFGTTDPEKTAMVENKSKVVGYMRLLRRTVRRKGVDSAETQFYIKELISAIDKVDDLAL